MPYRNPENQRAYDRERKRQTRAGCPTPRPTLVPMEFRLKTAADVLCVLEEQVGAVRSAPKLSVTERARTVAYLASVALRTIEAGDMAARLEALEAALRRRKEHNEQRSLKVV